MKGTFTVNTDEPKRGVLLCSGLAVGRSGEFVRAMEDQHIRAGLRDATLRFNFTGHGIEQPEHQALHMALLLREFI